MPIEGDFHVASADLRNMSREIRKEIRPAIQTAAEPLVAEAKNNASWSTRIPGAFRVVVLKTGVAIRVSRTKAPHARPYEGIASSSAFFRHPVYGNRLNWVGQRVRPYLQPAARAHRREVRKAIEKVIDDAARRHGFH